MNVVLVEPEIPPNTGNIARLCAATRTNLHLVEPLGFELTDRRLKRAGMDYWNHVQWRTWKNWNEFADANKTAKLWFVEDSGEQPYHKATFTPDDFLVFGRETSGLPPSLLKNHPDRVLHIPMLNPEARSLNLANCVGIVLFEALRQQGFNVA